MKKDGKKRVWFLLIFCTAVFAAFLVRLYWMQFTMADHYAKKLEQASQTRQCTPSVSPRDFTPVAGRLA